eukprot:605882-Pleurochrysis_carterae.AAC.1
MEMDCVWNADMEGVPMTAATGSENNDDNGTVGSDEPRKLGTLRAMHASMRPVMDEEMAVACAIQ